LAGVEWDYGGVDWGAEGRGCGCGVEDFFDAVDFVSEAGVAAFR
jgi:hypothetical protein